MESFWGRWSSLPSIRLPCLSNNLLTYNNKIPFVILFILNEFCIKPYLEMWGKERDWDRVEIVSLAHTPTSLYLTLCLRKVFFPKQRKPTQKPTPAWEIRCHKNFQHFILILLNLKKGVVILESSIVLFSLSKGSNVQKLRTIFRDWNF